MNLLLAINRERQTTCIMVRIAFHFARAAYGLLFGRSAVLCSFTFNSAIALLHRSPTTRRSPTIPTWSATPTAFSTFRTEES
jgi:hypothetical protein